jgi:hypothetical protein
MVEPLRILFYLSLQPAIIGTSYVFSHFYSDAGVAGKSSFLVILIFNLMVPLILSLFVPFEYIIKTVSPLYAFAFGMYSTADPNMNAIYSILILWG